MNELIGIAPRHAKEVTTSLNQLLADYQLYYQNLRIFHWRVTGRQFFTLHKYFEDLYQDARNNIDTIAERILTLGEYPVGHWSQYLDMAEIREAKGDQEASAMVSEVIANHSMLIRDMRMSIDKAEQSNDQGTEDMLVGMLKTVEKSTWMLRSWLKGVEVHEMA